jgi:Chromo (CHRromatin Organisation MOdifier) domain
MGRWHDVDCVSPAASERILWKLISASHLVFARCEETVEKTPRVFRCWLRSWTPSFLPLPFELPQRIKTRQRYYSYARQFLCYFYRIHHAARGWHEKTEDLSSLQLTATQVAMMDFVWAGFTDLQTECDKTSVCLDVPDSLLENLFQLIAMFWTDLREDGALESSAIANFSGVLGLHPRELVYRRAYDYTPYLSALIWVGRLVLLEYSLPLRPYSYLKLPWPARTSYPDQGRRLRDQLRPKYLQRGSLAPIGYLIERLQHGRAIARREGPRTNISWSIDASVLSIAKSEITMPAFRHTIHASVARAQQQAHDLLFGWWPDVQLAAVKDNLAIHQHGYSFLADPVNQLQNSFRVLSQRAFSPAEGFSLTSRGRQKAIRYLYGRDRLVRFLYGAIHLTSGMPARSEELRMIRWADTASVPRNVFVYRGQIILIFSYNKANTSRNNSFYIVRSPCPAVQHVLFMYLAYIRPFCDFLSRQLQIVTAPYSNLHLFTVHSEAVACFSTQACLKSLRESTPECPVQLSTSLYRQIAISIAKKHLPSLVQPFDPHTPQDYNGFLRLLAFQSGHKPQTHAGTYALEHEFPAKLQPELINRYLENSRAWHHFTLTRDEDVIDANVDCNLQPISQKFEALGYNPDQEGAPYSFTSYNDDSFTSSDEEHAYRSRAAFVINPLPRVVAVSVPRRQKAQHQEQFKPVLGPQRSSLKRKRQARKLSKGPDNPDSDDQNPIRKRGQRCDHVKPDIFFATSPTLIGSDPCGDRFEEEPVVAVDQDSNSASQDKDVEEEQQFQVKRIIDRRIVRGRHVQYQVEWENYPNPTDFTWEPLQQLREDVPEIVDAFERT